MFAGLDQIVERAEAQRIDDPLTAINARHDNCGHVGSCNARGQGKSPHSDSAVASESLVTACGAMPVPKLKRVINWKLHLRAFSIRIQAKTKDYDTNLSYRRELIDLWPSLNDPWMNAPLRLRFVCRLSFPALGLFKIARNFADGVPR